MEFQLVSQQNDKGNSPVFCYKVMLENVEGCTGTGYSKKESQQLASKLTLEQLRKQPQFIDAVFAAKSERTKMEEEPVLSVPETEPAATPAENSEKQEPVVKSIPSPNVQKGRETTEEEFDLSDISVRAQSREEIIAAAEAAAFEQVS